MRGITVFFTLVVVAAVLAAAAVGTYYFLRRKRDVRVHIPTRDSYRSPYNGGTTRAQTQQIYRLPPAPISYPRTSYRSPVTRTHGQAASKAFTPADDGVSHSSVASPHARTPSQTRPSSGRTPLSTTLSQPSATRTRPSLARAQLSPHISTHVASESKPRLPTAPAVIWPYPHSDLPASDRRQTTPRTPAPPDYGRTVHNSSVASPHIQTPSQTQLSSNCTHHVQVPSEHTRNEPPLPTVVQVISSDLHSDETASAEDLDFAKKLREQARRRRQELSEVRSRAKSARKKGYGGGARAYNREAIAHAKEMKELNERAAKIIFTEKDKNCKEGMIDLHGLHVPEALRFAKEQVQAAESRGDEVVRFIVGKGKHSNAGGAKIRPALEDHFTKYVRCLPGMRAPHRNHTTFSPRLPSIRTRKMAPHSQKKPEESGIRKLNRRHQERDPYNRFHSSNGQVQSGGATDQRSGERGERRTNSRNRGEGGGNARDTQHTAKPNSINPPYDNHISSHPSLTHHASLIPMTRRTLQGLIQDTERETEDVGSALPRIAQDSGTTSSAPHAMATRSPRNTRRLTGSKAIPDKGMGGT